MYIHTEHVLTNKLPRISHKDFFGFESIKFVYKQVVILNSTALDQRRFVKKNRVETVESPIERKKG